MAIYIEPNWRRYLPHIDIYMNVPLIRVQMKVFNEDYDLLTFTYLGFFWRILKWEGNVRLFETGNRFNRQIVEEDDVKRKRCGCWFSQKYHLNYYCNKHFAFIKPNTKKEVLKVKQ